jgi:hypothetical protein
MARRCLFDCEIENLVNIGHDSNLSSLSSDEDDEENHTFSANEFQQLLNEFSEDIDFENMEVEMDTANDVNILNIIDELNDNNSTQDFIDNDVPIDLTYIKPPTSVLQNPPNNYLCFFR